MMAESPFSVGSGKPTISRVPEGGGGAFRPRPVRGAAKMSAPGGASPAPQGPQEAVAIQPSGQDRQPQGEDHSALWERLAAINARRQALKDRTAQWSGEGVGVHG